MGMRNMAALLLAALAATTLACGSIGADAGGQNGSSNGSATLDPGTVDYIDGAQGTANDSGSGPSLQP